MKSNLLFLIILIALLFLAGSGYSQSHYEDVVYLKNGSVIHGMIIEQVPNESIKIQTQDRNIFVFKMDEVLKMTKEEVQLPATAGKSHKIEPVKKMTRKTTGYTNILEWGFARSFTETHSEYAYGGYGPYDSHFDRINNGPSFGIQDVNGYLFNPYFSAGVGIGMQAYNELFLVPFFLDLRVNFMETRLTPFVVVDLGHSFTRQQFFGIETNYQDEGGFMGSFMAGVKYYPVPRMGLNFSMGFRYQEITVENDYSNSYYNEPTYSDKSMNQFTVKVGLSF
jgi:hypothetical protein